MQEYINSVNQIYDKALDRARNYVIGGIAAGLFAIGVAAYVTPKISDLEKRLGEQPENSTFLLNDYVVSTRRAGIVGIAGFVLLTYLGVRKGKKIAKEAKKARDKQLGTIL